MMKFWQELVDLYGKGGLEIVTEYEQDAAAAKQPLLIRTVVQPDADIITWVHPGAESVSLWERHQRKLQSKIRSAQRVRWLLKYAGFILVLVPFTIYNAFTRELIPLIASFLLSITAAFLFRYLIALVLRLYIRHQLDKYLSTLFEM